MKIYAVFDTNILVSAMISKRSDTAVVLALDTLLLETRSISPRHLSLSRLWSS